MTSRAAHPPGAPNASACSAALQHHEEAPVEMSEREKFLLDMNGDRAQPTLSIEQIFFKTVDVCSIAPQDFWWWKTF